MRIAELYLYSMELLTLARRPLRRSISASRMANPCEAKERASQEGRHRLVTRQPGAHLISLMNDGIEFLLEAHVLLTAMGGGGHSVSEIKIDSQCSAPHGSMPAVVRQHRECSAALADDASCSWVAKGGERVCTQHGTRCATDEEDTAVGWRGLLTVLLGSGSEIP